MLSEVFWVAFITTISGMIIKLASMAYKSKCKECEVCCIKVKRDVDLEEKENEFEITHQLKKSGSDTHINQA
jgi:aldehyde:ferredoxin oxidoreductase